METCACCETSTGGLISKVVDELCLANTELVRWRDERPGRRLMPDRNAVLRVVEDLRSVLFPGYHGNCDLTREGVRYHIGATLDRVRDVLFDQVKRSLCFVCEQKESQDCSECEDNAHSMVDTFLQTLPSVAKLLASDVQAAFEGDPAARSSDETILCYPGVLANTNHRLAHELFKLEVPLLPRIMSEHAHSVTGIDIHPGAAIGERFFIDHGTGVVIGETCVLGRNVRIYQGVTLGAKSFPLDNEGKPIKGVPRHPMVEDDVIIYGGATVLGRITIGKGSVIGGNVWLTRSIPPGTKLSLGTPAPDSNGGN